MTVKKKKKKKKKKKNGNRRQLGNLLITIQFPVSTMTEPVATNEESCFRKQVAASGLGNLQNSENNLDNRAFS